MGSVLLLILVVFAVPGLVLLVRKPRWSLYLMVASFPMAALPAALDLGSHLLTPQKFFGVLAVFFFLFDVLVNRRKVQLKGPLPALVILLFLLLLLSHFSNTVVESAWIQRYLANGIFVLLILNFVEDREQLNNVFVIFVVAVFLAVLTTELVPELNWLQVRHSKDTDLGSRLTASFENPNTAAQAYILALGFSGAWLISKKPTVRSLLPGVPMVLSMAYLTLATGARSAFLAFLVLLLLTGVLFLRSRGGRLGLVALLGFGIWMVVDPPEVMERRIKTIPYLTQEARESNPEADGPRTLQYRFAAEQILASPIFGLGPEMFSQAYAQRGGENLARVLHSWYLAVAADAGIPAMLVFLGLFAMAFQAFWRSAQAAQDERLRLSRQLLAIMVLATAVFGLFSSIPFNKFVFFLVGVAATEWKLSREEQARELAAEASAEAVVVVQGRPLGSARRNAWRY